MRGAVAITMLWVCLIWPAPVCAQYPSPLPLPRLPIPRRGGGQGKDTPADKKAPANKVVARYNGSVAKLSAESITVETDDTRIIDFRCGKDTRYAHNQAAIQRSVLKPGDEVGVDAWKDDDGYFHAVAVYLRKLAASRNPPPAAGEPAAPPKEDPTTVMTPRPAAPDPDDPGPPALRRGAPPSRRSPAAGPIEVSAGGSGVTPPALIDPGPSKQDAFLDKVRQTALEFSEALPNYLCKQFTTRFQSEGRSASWQALDVVSTALVYEDGKESYHDIRINDKPTKKEMDSIPGSRSRGEFGSTLRDLFSPTTAAVFRYRRESTASGLPASVYDFQVEQPYSHWENRVAGQSLFPSYKGSVWVDRKTHRVLRIEMQARNIPPGFPLDTSEWVVDYSFVRIGTGQYLLPVHAENLACFRGTSTCTRNVTDFRNYRKFTSESQIMTVDSAVTFDGEEAPPKPPAKKR